MYAFVVEKSEGEYDMYHTWIHQIWIHTQVQNSEKLCEEFQWRNKFYADSVNLYLKEKGLKKNKANKQEAEKFVQSYAKPITWEEFMLEKGFMKIEKFDSNLD